MINKENTTEIQYRDSYLDNVGNWETLTKEWISDAIEDFKGDYPFNDKQYAIQLLTLLESLYPFDFRLINN